METLKTVYLVGDASVRAGIATCKPGNPYRKSMPGTIYRENRNMNLGLCLQAESAAGEILRPYLFIVDFNVSYECDSQQMRRTAGICLCLIIFQTEEAPAW